MARNEKLCYWLMSLKKYKKNKLWEEKKEGSLRLFAKHDHTTQHSLFALAFRSKACTPKNQVIIMMQMFSKATNSTPLPRENLRLLGILLAGSMWHPVLADPPASQTFNTTWRWSNRSMFAHVAEKTAPGSQTASAIVAQQIDGLLSIALWRCWVSIFESARNVNLCSAIQNEK